MIYCIMGRTGSGKDHLAKMLARKGLRNVLSYATRPKRFEKEATHVFITKEEAAKIPTTERAASTVIGEYEYFATKEQVKDSDIYIIDPKGLMELARNMPDTAIHVVYVHAPEEDRLKRASVRGGKDKAEAEKEAFIKRSAAEDEQFKEFEEFLDAYVENDGAVPDEFDGYGLANVRNITAYRTFENDYNEEAAREFTDGLYKYIKCQNGMHGLVRQALDRKVLGKGEGDTIRTVINARGKGEMIEDVCYDVFADILMHDDEGLAMLTRGIITGMVTGDDNE